MACAGHTEVLTKFSPTAAHFFKIILQQTLRNKLQIPKAFWMKYCGSLSSQVILKVPCGSRWEVGLTKSEGNVWIEKGWNKFAEYYSLSHGYLLVFRYEGNSQFNVTIFGKTTVEIDYPSNPNHLEKHVDTNEEDDVSVEVLDRFSWYPKTRVNSQPHKKMRPSEAQTNQSDLRSKVVQKGSLLSCKEESGNTTGNTTALFAPKRYPKPLSVSKNTPVIERSSYFQSEYPFFVVVMKASYITGGKGFHIPSRFANTYITKRECEASLWVSNGKSWSVYLKVRLVRENKRAEFTSGWKAFVHENSLEVGDICKFELTKNDNEISFRVSSVKGDDDAYDYLAAKVASTSKQNVKCDSSLTRNDKASMISHDIFLKKEQEKNVVELPDEEDDVSIEVLDSFSWYSKTMVNSQPHKKMRPSEAKTNLSHLRSKVMQKGSLSSRVESGYIFGLSTPRRYQKPSSVHRITSSLGRGIHFQSEYPSFTVIMKASYANGRRTLHIPCRFAETYINQKECEASLWLSNGRSWSVYYKVKSIDGYTSAQFSHGWKAFSLENSLEVGDICTFELTNNCGNEISFRVSINKSDDAHNYSDKSTKMTSEANTGHQGTNKRPLSSVILTASEATSHFFSQNPSFQVALLSDHVQGYKLHIPLTFASLYLEEKAQTMTLWVGEENWHVKLIVNGSDYKFSAAGWGAFARDNSLQPRDVCIFELIKRNQPAEMKVIIMRENFLYF